MKWMDKLLGPPEFRFMYVVVIVALVVAIGIGVVANLLNGCPPFYDYRTDGIAHGIRCK